jgi:protein gp37
VSDNSTIEWTEATWNPTTGCDKVSPGCDNCYALTLAKRLKRMGQAKYQNDGDPRTSGPGFGLTVHPDALDIPRGWKTGKRIFVNSMSDLFHKDVPDDFIAQVFAVMAATPQHTYQVLTKRHARMRALLSSEAFDLAVAEAWTTLDTDAGSLLAGHTPPYPLPNLWLGVSVEDQHWADIRIPALLDTPAAVRWISAEPLLGPIDLRVHLTGHCPTHDFPGGFCVQRRHPGVQHLDWVVVGGESGPGARPMHPDWARTLRDQCDEQDVPFLFKQWGAWAPTGAIGIGTLLDCTPTGFVRQPPRRDPNRCYAGAPFQDVNGLPYSPEMVRVGKGKAGRELDGRTWDEYPGGDA